MHFVHKGTKGEIKINLFLKVSGIINLNKSKEWKGI